MTFARSLSSMGPWTRSVSLLIATLAAPKALASWKWPTTARRNPPLLGSKAKNWRAVPSRSTKRSRANPVVNRADPAGKSHGCETAALWGGRCWGGRRLQEARGAAQPHTPMGLRCRTAPHESLRLTTRITTLPRPDVARRRGGEERAPGTLCARMRPSTYPRRTGMETGAASRVRRGHTPFTEEKHGMAVRLFVGNLPYDVTEAELRAHFAAVGPLAYLSLAMDRDTGKPRGFAFVEFSARADAEDAMRRLHNHLFKGRPLAVNEARARDAPAPSSAPRPAGSRPPSAADPSPEAGRDFGPDAAPRRRRPLAKRAAHAQRGPKRPIYKRAPGPVRFSAGDEDEDEDEGRGAYAARHRADADAHDPA